MKGYGISWETVDSDFKDVKRPHLTELNDSLTNCEQKVWTTGSDGKITFKLKAYGNLGSKAASLTRKGLSSIEIANMKSDGSTEDELIKRIKPVIDRPPI